MDAYKPRPEIIFVEEVADFRKFVTDKDQPNIEGVSGNVLVPLNGIRDHKQFRIKQVVGVDGFAKTEFHAKHLSTTQDWGEAVEFVRYIPTSSMWVAPQMALKSASGNVGREEKETTEDKETRSDDEEEGTRDTIVLGNYRKAIIDQGFNYFGDKDKLWWIKFFEKQEEILRTHLDSTQWRFEWTWPARYAPVSRRDVQIQPPVPAQLLEKVTGPQKVMYSGRRKVSPSFGDYTDMETNTRFSMICVKAHGDPVKKLFWVAKVRHNLTH
jgi:hypothetical protein